MLQDSYITLAQTLTIISRRGHLFRSILFQSLKKYRGQLMELNGIRARVILRLFSSSVLYITRHFTYMCCRRGRATVATITFTTSRLNRYVRWIFENMQDKLAEVIFLIKKELKIY